MYKISILVFAFLLMGGCRSSKIQTPPVKKPINVILVIGDGMGLTQVTAGMYSNGNTFELERCPVVGLIKTHAYDDLITDSAAGATAFATGKKTYLGAIGVNKDTMPVRTLFDIAQRRELGTGIVVTSELTHATPAAFFAHEAYRLRYENIAEDFLNSGIDIAIGGGLKYFRDRQDSKSLLPKLQKKGYFIRNWQTEIEGLRVPPDQKLLYFTAMDQPVRKTKGRDYLPAATKYALEFLDQRFKGGFMLMVEGSQIDWGGHANNGEYVVAEMLDFNETLKNVLDFAEADGHTLVIVTADHETGGLAIKRGSEMGNLKLFFGSGGHTGTMIPVYAYGPGAEMFGGIYDNTDIFNKVRRVMGWKK